jgi:predicted HD phosphohydrolase
MSGTDNDHGERGAAWLARWFPVSAGGPMSAAEAAGFRSEQRAGGAIAVRRWDDEAKDPSADVPGFDWYRPLLESLLPR